MNRIEEAIQKAKALARAREQDSPAARREAEVVHAGPRPAPTPVPSPAPSPAVELPRVPPAPAVRTLTVNRAELARAGIWPADTNARRLADEFRVVKRGVLAQFKRVPGPNATRRTITVASALPGEGKTFSSFHLAMNLALERDLDVLLIDGDVARPTLTRALGCEGQPGLLNCIESASTPLEDVLYRTDIEGLWFMPAGDTVATRAELLSSPRMRTVLDEACARIGTCTIVIDSPPLLPTVESRALVDATDQTLLVVKANSTPQSALLQALDSLGEGRHVQLMLNQRRETRLDQYYYYGYGAAYGAKPE